MDPYDALMGRLKSCALQGRGGEVVLAGAAGTGKTTLVRRIVQSWSGEVALLAPTGKAARRLTEVVGRKADTIHATIYGGPAETPDGEIVWSDPKPVGGEDGLVIVDEASMVGQELATDLRIAAEKGTVVLWVGDPHQLPPVADAPGVDLTRPDVSLTHIHRSTDNIVSLSRAILQAKTAPELSMLIQRIHDYPGVYNPGDVRPETWRAETMRVASDSMLITHQNGHRHQINLGTRRKLGVPDDVLQPGEPLVVMTTNRNLGLANGELVALRKVYQDDPDCPINLIQIKVQASNGRIVSVYTDPEGFGQDSRGWREARREGVMAWRSRMYAPDLFLNPRWRQQAFAYNKGELARTQLPGPDGDALHVHFGYCLTCHKMQGSEADTIGIVWAGVGPDGVAWSNWWWLKKDLDSVRAWWYTAVTRAKTAVIVWK